MASGEPGFGVRGSLDEQKPDSLSNASIKQLAAPGRVSTSVKSRDLGFPVQIPKTPEFFASGLARDLPSNQALISLDVRDLSCQYRTTCIE